MDISLRHAAFPGSLTIHGRDQPLGPNHIQRPLHIVDQKTQAQLSGCLLIAPAKQVSRVMVPLNGSKRMFGEAHARFGQRRVAANAKLDFAFGFVTPVQGMVVWIHGHAIRDALRRRLAVPVETHRHDLCIRGKTYGLVLPGGRVAVDTLVAGFFVGVDRIRSFLFGLRQPKSHRTDHRVRILTDEAAELRVMAVFPPPSG